MYNYFQISAQRYKKYFIYASKKCKMCPLKAHFALLLYKMLVRSCLSYRIKSEKIG